MSATPARFPSLDYPRELNLLEQVHTALGSAARLEDFYIITCSMLVDPNTFGFSRAFLLRFDERSHTYTGKIALGSATRQEHERNREELAQEDQRIRELVEEIQRQSPEPVAVQQLLDLRYHGLWIQALQGRQDGENLDEAFRQVTLDAQQLPGNHLISRTAASPHALLMPAGECNIEGLPSFIECPLVSGRLVTKRGLHAIVIADRKFEATPLSGENLVHFQWLLNHAAVTLDNVELVSELTRTTERLKEVDRMKTNFLSIVSHELRTPLTSIIGFVHLLTEGRVGDLTPPQADLLKRVSHHSSHLQNMVNDLLEIAEVEAGGMINVTLKPVDPLSVVLQVLPKLELRRSMKKVEVQPVVEQAIPQVKADATALDRTLFHLLDNALKFSKPGGRVTITFNTEGSNLHIAVNDEGIGIPDAELKRIFEHFYQVDFRLERAFGGMGIGLTVVRLLLEATGGHITVKSAPGKGSSFILTYPVAENSAP